MEFLPDGYETLKIEKKYWKPSEFKKGDNKFRIVCRPIAGWIDWKDNKPHRFKPAEKPKSSFDPTKPLRPFWAMYVWDYERSDLFILEVVQASIIKALESYGSDPDWGDFTNYDIKVRKEGTGKDTEYFISPMPHKPLLEEGKMRLGGSTVRLEALYEGKDPWTDLVPGDMPSADISDAQLECIERFLAEDEKAQALIKERFKIESISKIPHESFDDVLKWLAVRREKRDASKEVA